MIKKCSFSIGKICILLQILLLAVIAVWAFRGRETEVFSVENLGAIEEISLPVGTYGISITYQSDALNNAITFISREHDNAFLADTLQLDPNKTTGYLEVWVLKNLNDIKQAHKFEAGNAQVYQVTLVRTPQFRRMICMGLLSVLILLDLVWIYGHKLRQMDLAERKSAVLRHGVLLLTALVCCIPLMGNRIFAGHDLIFHLSRIEGLKEGLKSGQFPVRIQPMWFNGAGYAVSIMYGDWLLYIPALFRLCGYPLQTCVKMYMILVTVGTALLCYYGLTKVVRGKWSCVFGAVAYTASLYRLADVFVRHALGEYTAIMFYPLLFCGFIRILQNSGEVLKGNAEEDENEKQGVNRRNWMMPAIGMTGLLTCHAISSVLAVFILAIYMLLRIKDWISVKRVATILKTIGATVALSAAFLIPFLDYYLTQPMRINHTELGRFDHIQEEGMNWKQLMQSFPGFLDHKLFGLAAIIVLIVAIGFLLVRKDCRNREIVSAVMVTLFTVWISTIWFPWNNLADAVPGVTVFTNSIQYAFRFLGIAMFWIAYLVALATDQMDGNQKTLLKTTLVVTGIFYLTSSAFYIRALCHGNTYEVYDESGLGLYAGYGVKASYNCGEGEYLPPEAEMNDACFLTGNVNAPEGIEVEISDKKGVSITTCVDAFKENDTPVLLPLLYYRGYNSKDDAGHSIATEKGTAGHVEIRIPAGFNGVIRTVYNSPIYWRVAEVISLLSFITLIYITGYEKRIRHGV